MMKPLKARKNALPPSTSGAVDATFACEGHRRWPMSRTTHSSKAAASAGTNRGHHAFTPNTFQPAWNSQNSNGGLWL